MKKRIASMLALLLLFMCFTGIGASAETQVTWNPGDKGSGVTLSNNNLTMSYTNYINSNVRATEGKSTGKWYWEIECVSSNLHSAVNMGVAYKSVPITNYIYNQFINTAALYREYPHDTGIYGFALDIEGGTLQVFKNGTSVSIESLPTPLSEDLYPIIGDDNGSASATYTANFGMSDFVYPIPDGYQKYDSSAPQPQTPPNTPLNLTAVEDDAKITLSWDKVADATSYTVKRSLNSGGPYVAISSGSSICLYVDSTVSNDTTYYYVVTALNDSIESSNSNEVSATPHTSDIPSNSNNAILTVHLMDGSEREYDLKMESINDFIDWFESEGSSSPYFVIDVTYNMGPFKSRKDFLAYDKILMFEVNEY